MKHIYPEVSRRRYTVDIKREGVKYRAHIPFGAHPAAALLKAVAIRDEFLQICGEVIPRSNTGLRGISETTKWYDGKPYACFHVRRGRKSHQFFFRTFTQRETALAKAQAWRSNQR